MKKFPALFLFFSIFFLLASSTNKAYAGACKANNTPKDNINTHTQLSIDVTQTKRLHVYSVSLMYDDINVNHGQPIDKKSRTASKDIEGLNFVIDLKSLNIPKGDYKIIASDDTDPNDIDPGCFDGYDIGSKLERKITIDEFQQPSICTATFSPTNNIGTTDTLTVNINNAKIGETYVARLSGTKPDGFPDLNTIYYEETQQAGQQTLKFSIDLSRHAPGSGILSLFAGNYNGVGVDSTENCFDTAFKTIIVGNLPPSSLCPVFSRRTDPPDPKLGENISLLFQRIGNDTSVYSVTVDKNKNFTMAPSMSSIDVGSYNSGNIHSFSMKINDSSNPNNGADCPGGEFTVQSIANPLPCAEWIEPIGKTVITDISKIEDPKYNKICNEVNTAVGNISTQPYKFVQDLLTIFLSLSGGIALLLIIFSGYKYMTSQGNPEKLQGAKETLTSAIVGLLFIIFAMVILQLIGVDILRIPGFK